MATEPLSTTRRALLGAAASLPLLCAAPVRAEPVEALTFSPAATRWNRRLARYRRLAERAKEAAETGFLRKANLRYERDRSVIKSRFGSWEDAIETSEGSTLGEAAFARVTQAEEAFYDRCSAPLHRAAVLLASTPALDFPALLAKIGVLQELELGEFEILGRSVMEVLAEDVGRLLTNSKKPASVS